MDRFVMSDIEKNSSVHFIGIGGISMSGLAQIILKNGYKVTGSDWNRSEITKKLENMGADIVYGRDAVHKEGIKNASLVVYTAAAKADNPEIITAKELKKRVIDRAEFLGAIMKNYKHAVGVSGTHGKTTTTSMLAHALIHAGIDPTISVGGELDLIGGNIRTGSSDYFVTEACEYTNSFLKFYPTIALITNIEEDHLDFFSGIDEIIESFRQFAYLTKDIGYVVAMGEDENIKKALKNADDLNIITYGMEDKFDYYPSNIVYHAGFPSFDVMNKGNKICSLRLNVPGEHNILNSLATIAVCSISGVDAETASKGIETFKGTHRRFEKKGFLNGAVVIDDYAHHPTEIKATLHAAKKFPHNKIWCVFQPHTYSRTRTLWNEFTHAFNDADELILTHIYAAREKFDGVTKPENLSDDILKNGVNSIYIDDFNDIAAYLKENVHEGDIVFTMGAGDVVDINKLIIE
jgi:UDP-N-acetylmuramate--alanine ligase